MVCIIEKPNMDSEPISRRTLHMEYRENCLTYIIDKLLTYVDTNTPIGGRSSVQLIAEKGI